MAYQTIYREDIYEWTQEEEKETNLVAGEDGKVEEVTTILQPYIHIRGEIVVQQEVLADNYSNFIMELKAHVTTGEWDEGNFRLYTRKDSMEYDKNYDINWIKVNVSDGYIRRNPAVIPNNEVENHYINPNETKVLTIDKYTFESKNGLQFGSIDKNYKDTKVHFYHDLDGKLTGLTCQGYNDYGSLKTSLKSDGIVIGASLSWEVYVGDVRKTTITSNYERDITGALLASNKPKVIIYADDFTDEENPNFTYEVATTPYNSAKDTTNNVYGYVEDTVVSLQAALSLDGETADIPYRDISINDSSYTFGLTEAERELLRVKTQNLGTSQVPIYYLTKTIRTIPEGTRISHDTTSGYYEAEAQTAELVSVIKRNFTIVGCDPQLNPTVKDIKPETLALTGDENTFIRYESMAEYAINATASKYATIVSQSVQCGSKTISNLPQGVIDDVESGTFIFNVTDSRGMGASSSVFKNLIEYVKPTCYQKEEIEITGETGANIKVTVNGSYFNGSFGAANNTLLLEVRHTDGNGNWGAWMTLSGTPTFDGTTYKLEAKLTGFDYGKAYVFQCRATDKLNVVQSSQYTIRMLPVFDWSENDFNFNVPVNIDAEDLSMHGETIIRHSDTTNNTVLSASNGNIYIRPKGTDNTSGQTILYNNGNVDFSGNATFGGTVNFSHSFTIGGYILNDYVIESGSEAMGSNGTWYWQKWLNGKAEAWGCRNFGNMAVSTAWGNLYRSAVFTQDLPDDVFNTTPDAININFVHTDAGGWISKYQNTAPSAVTTGSFVVVRPVSGNITPTNIGFYVVGRWY